MSLGSDEVCGSELGATTCCSNCSGGVIPYVDTDVLAPEKATRNKRRGVVREISEDVGKKLKDSLLGARKSIMSSSPGYQMLGHNFVCPDKTISDICVNAKYITNVNDVDMLFLRPDFRQHFFDIVSTCVCNAPPPTKRSRTESAE